MEYRCWSYPVALGCKKVRSNRGITPNHRIKSSDQLALNIVEIISLIKLGVKWRRLNITISQGEFFQLREYG